MVIKTTKRPNKVSLLVFCRNLPRPGFSGRGLRLIGGAFEVHWKYEVSCSATDH